MDEWEIVSISDTNYPCYMYDIEVEGNHNFFANGILSSNCHMAKDINMYNLLNKFIINAEYKIGLTGTPFRTDGADLEMNALIGFVIYSKSTKELQDEGYISRSNCTFYSYNENEIYGIDYHSAYENLTKHDIRNRKICDLCEYYADKRILIIVNRIEHGTILSGMIKDSLFISGSTAGKERKEIFEKVNAKPTVLIGMSQIMSTGINLPNLDIIINASANKSDVVTLQTIGRVLRKAEGKDEGKYFDFLDKGQFEDATQFRIDALQEYGHSITYE